MRLTYHSDYGLRLLMLLALEPDSLHTIEDAASRYDISRNHLMKVAVSLVQAGLVESVRGRRGGLRLARPAVAITVADALRATGEDFQLVECFDREHKGCAVRPACRLKGVLHEAVAAFLAVLNRYTLQDLVAAPAHAEQLRQLLHFIDFPARSAELVSAAR